MPTREAQQAAEELAVFNAYLATHTSFASRVAAVRQPDAEFPDVTVQMHDGSEVDFELAEWLQPDQMAMGKRRERLVEAIMNAIGEQGQNNSQHFRFVLLFPRSEYPSFKRSDVKEFRKDIWDLIGETEKRWMTERHWRSPQGRHVSEFDFHPTLGKYVSKVIVDPINVAGNRQKFPAGIPWIDVSMPCSSYSPDTALNALESILSDKVKAYGCFSRQPRLLVYYGIAVAYNTPWYGIDFREFKDVAIAATQMVAGQSVFEKIFVMKALEPELEVYEVFPRFRKCE